MVGEPRVAGDGLTVGVLSDEVNRLADTVQACDRLCLLSAQTLTRCAIRTAGKDTQDGPRVFIPSVSRDLHSIIDENEEPDIRPGRRGRPRSSTNRHPTTSAQCITALQELLPVVGRFRLGTPASKDLAFHPIERSALEAFDPDRVSRDVRATIERSLQAFLRDRSSTGRTAADGKPPQLDLAEIRAAEESLTSNAFGYLHPFTAACVLRAIAPSEAQFTPVWWRSLFTILWFLFRRAGGPHGHPNTQATNSPGTAFLTAKCVDALDMVLDVFERRRRRFQKLIKLIEELKTAQATREQLRKLPVSPAIFENGYAHKEENLVAGIHCAIREIAADTSLKLYHRWRDNVDHGVAATRKKGNGAVAGNAAFLQTVASAFAQAVRSEISDGQTSQRQAARANIEGLEELVKIAGAAYKCVGERLAAFIAGAPLTAQQGKRGAELLRSLDELPDWLCSGNYWNATRRVAGGSPLTAPTPGHSAVERASREIHWQNLENHWRRHHDAAENAITTVKAFSDYLDKIFSAFEKLRDRIDGETQASKIEVLLECLSDAAEHLYRLRHQVSRARDMGVKWADILMNRHLAYATSGVMMQFDPGELAHAVRIVSAHGGMTRLDVVITSLLAVCAAQRSDGTWACQQPVYWTDTGFSAPTSSIETAWAVVSAVNEILPNAERFGASSEEVSARLQPVYAALDRFFRWLSGTLQSIPTPAALLNTMSVKSRDSEPPLYGWCSDRAPEPGRIHSWNTASAIEFLVAFRRLQHERITLLLRARFLSHHPAELTPLSEVEPTDLANLNQSSGQRPVISQLLELLREHKALELVEGPWLPSGPPEAKIRFWSCLLYGPPGTSKTFLAKAVAAELGWPLISLSPSDFLAKGEQNIESCAQEIFTSLKAGSRLVYFFDEIDEMIRERRKGEQRRSVFSFLTPSFLTKLQDFRDAAKKNEFIFILGTNYFDRIDSAAKRSGRIDREFPIVYPDMESRGYMIMQHLVKARGNKDATDVKEQLAPLAEYLREREEQWKQLAPKGCTDGLIDLFAKFTGFLSYPKLMELSKRLSTLKDPGDIETLIGELRAISEGTSAAYKPEINLSDYSDRGPDAFDEIARIAAVMPAEAFPAAAGARQSLLARQIGQLYEATADSELRQELEQKFGSQIAKSSRKRRNRTPAR
jgi:ATPase family associated with various cellular activities (AAA)